MKSIKLILATLAFLFLIQAVSAQSEEKRRTEEKPLQFSMFPSDNGTNNPEAEKLRNKGIELMGELKIDEAITAFSKAIELDPKYADAYNRRGAAYSWKRNVDKAIADLSKSIDLNPKVSLTYLNRGSEYLTNRNYDSAAADFTKAIELDSENELLYFMRADAYEKLGRKDLAAADRQKFKEIIKKRKQQSTNKSLS